MIRALMVLIITISLISTSTIALAGRKERPITVKLWSMLSTFDKGVLIDGELDCLSSDVFRGNRRINVSTEELVASISRSYGDIARYDDVKLLSLLRQKIRGSQYTRATNSDGGEKYPELHGYYDGDYWWQAGETSRIQFVRGYVDCYDRYIGTISNEVLAIKNAVDRHYGIRRGGEVVDDAKSSDKIAIVIQSAGQVRRYRAVTVKRRRSAVITE